MADSTAVPGTTKPALTGQHIELLSRGLEDSETLARRRQGALEIYQQTPLPRRSSHLWRYADLPRLLGGPDPQPLQPVVPLHLPPLGALAAVGVVQPGARSRFTLAPALEQAGLRLLPLGAAGAELGRLGSLVGARHGLFEALNLAAWAAGALLHVPAGLKVATPIHLLLPASLATSIARLLVVVERDAEVTVIEEHHGEGSRRANTVSEIFVAPGARVRHVLLQRWGSEVSGHQTLRGQVERDAELQLVLATLGGRSAKVDAGAQLVGPGAHAELSGFILGDGRQHLDLHTEQQHLAPHTTSNIDFKVVLGGRASAAYTGKIRIAQDAPGCQALQENRNLLLSRRARAHSIPELEILTDDVSCTHGATVSPVDVEQLTYLRSRGIAPAEALQLVVGGFLETTLARLPEALRADLADPVQARVQALCGVQR